MNIQVVDLSSEWLNDSIRPSSQKPEGGCLPEDSKKNTPDYRQLRIVIVSRSLGLSGSTTWSLAMQGALREMGCPVLHIVIGESGAVPIPQNYNVQYTGRTRRHPLLRICRLLQVHRLLSAWYESKADQIVARKVTAMLRQRNWHDHLDMVIKNFSNYSPSCLNEHNVVAVIHQKLSLDWQDPKLRLKALPSLTLAGVSHAVATDAAKLGLRVPHILYNPLDADLIRRRAGELPLHDNFLLFAGKLDSAKGVYQLLDAYARSQVQLPLWFVGDGRERAGLEDRMRELGLQKRVRFLGFQPNPFPYIAQASLLLLPSHCEAMSYVCLEAAVLGTPFLVSDFEAAREFFEDRAILALQPEVDFVERLAQRIRTELEQPSSPAVREDILRKLAPKMVALSYLELIDDKPSL